MSSFSDAEYILKFPSFLPEFFPESVFWGLASEVYNYDLKICLIKTDGMLIQTKSWTDVRQSGYIKQDKTFSNEYAMLHVCMLTKTRHL